MSANPDILPPEPSNILPFDDPRARASLYCKMARVMGELTRLEKTGWNKFHQYKYASESDVADAVRHAMAIHNLALFVQIVRIERIDTGRKTSGGSPTILTRVQVEFTFADGDTGATEHRIWEGEALDSDDKGINKAVTAAEKYFLLKTFIMSSGDKVDDPDESVDEAVQQRKAAPKKPVASIQQQPNGNKVIILDNPETPKLETDGSAALKPDPSNEKGKRILGRDEPKADDPKAEPPAATWETNNILDHLLAKVRKELGHHMHDIQPSDIMRLVGMPDKEYKVLAYWTQQYQTPKAAFEAIKDAIEFEVMAK